MPGRRVALLLAVAALATGCATGPRPSLGDDAASIALGGEAGTPVGDAAVDTVLGLLERPAGQDFTARYQIVRRLGDVRADGTVVRDGEDVSVTVGDVRFLPGSAPRTCSLASGTCEDGIVEQRISDTAVGSAFWAAGPARALRVAYTRRSGAPAPTSKQVAGRSAQCVDVPVGPGTERYCASDLGPLAVWSTADKTVELTSLDDVADPTAFTVPQP